MTDERADQIPLDARLKSCREKAVGALWPLPVDHRLEQLVQLTNDTGERTDRKELLAAIVLAVTEDPDELSEMLRTYRRATVHAALINPTIEGNVVTLPRYKSGPRPRGTLSRPQNS
jgi:hypothetical protein